MTELSRIIQDWRNEKERYSQFSKYIEKSLSDSLAIEGIKVRVHSRTKSQESIIKKLYMKNQINYEYYKKMTDKSAARIICRLKEDIPYVEKIIENSFIVVNKEDKINLLDFNEQGYKSIHFDVQPKKELTEPTLFRSIGDLIGEIQLRTSCEDVWAEIYHNIGYKPSSPLPKDMNREFHCLAGLLEVADNCFSVLSLKIKSSENIQEYFLLDYLITPFFQYVCQSYDPEFSRKNLQALIPLIDTRDPSEFIEKMTSFINTNKEKIVKIFKERTSDSEIPYITQPEIFLIFYLVDNRYDELLDVWSKNFFIEDLKKMCLWWGKPFEDDEY